VRERGGEVSYSVCFKCKEMVSRYEKYCVACAKKYKQDELYWKTRNGHPNDLQREETLKIDKFLKFTDESEESNAKP